MRFLKSLMLLFILGVIILPVAAEEIPDSVLRALRDVPEDCLVGFGMAKAETDWDSMSLAETMARVEIARAYNQEVNSVISVYTATNEDSSLTMNFTEEISESISNANIYGSRIVELVKTGDGTWWCVVYCGKYSLLLNPGVFQRLPVPNALSY